MTLPFAFLIGDSISMQYGPYLKQYLQGKVIYARKGDFENNPDFESNGGDSSAVIDYLNTLIERKLFQANYLLINCGLHDIRHNLVSNEYQVNPVLYKNNLTTLVDRYSLLSEKLIWINSTPVHDETHNTINKEFFRFNADVELYNQIAENIMHSVGVTIIDLYSFTLTLGQPDELYEDHVHYREAYRRLQAAFIAGNLLQLS